MGLLSSLLRRNEAPPPPSVAEPAEVYRQMRDTVLRLDPDDIGLPPSTDPVAVIMETGYSEAVATLVAVADGSTSLYFSNGGGVIGAGEHEPVRDATLALLRSTGDHLAEMSETDETPLPDEDRVRFFVVRAGAVLTAEAGADDLGRGRLPLSPLFHAGHRVIAAIREHTPG